GECLRPDRLDGVRLALELNRLTRAAFGGEELDGAEVECSFDEHLPHDFADRTGRADHRNARKHGNRPFCRKTGEPTHPIIRSPPLAASRPMQSSADEPWMRRAIELAERGRGHVEPNPLVGAVVASDGRVIGEGWHEKFGHAHAEVNAL